MPVLDTTLLIDLARDPEAHRDLLEDLTTLGERLIVPAQAAIEFAAGDTDPAAALRDLRSSFTVADVDERTMLEAAEIAAEAFAEGRFPGWADIQIAATARARRMAVVTRNEKNFQPLGVDVLAY